MKRVVVDITELDNWHGRLTGVPRVMNEISQRFRKRENTIFVVWDGARMQYRLVELPSSIDFELTLDMPIVRVGYRRTIEKVKRLKNKSVLISRALSVPERIARRVLRPAPNVESQATFALRRGDTLFVLADWHGSDVNFSNYLVDAQQRGVAIIQICYDLLPIVAPQYSGHSTEYFTRYTKAVYPICKSVIAISEGTQADITDWLRRNKLKTPSIGVIRLGDDFHFAAESKPVEADFERAGIRSGGYALCVGTVEARKNHALLYYTYKLARQRRIELPKILIVGRRGYRSDDTYELITADPDTKNQLIFLADVSDNELSWLYNHCLFSIYPSFYEGWGLPIAESLSRGVPCICSDTSSMPEVGGELVSYFSPNSSDECLARISDLLVPKALALARKRAEKYRMFSWDETYDQIRKIIVGL